jgi:hypothetical protein
MRVWRFFALRDTAPFGGRREKGSGHDGGLGGLRRRRDKAAGLRVAHVRRGPWGHLWADDPVVTRLADWRITSLAELPGLLAPEARLPR